MVFSVSAPWSMLHVISFAQAFEPCRPLSAEPTDPPCYSANGSAKSLDAALDLRVIYSSTKFSEGGQAV